MYERGYINVSFKTFILLAVFSRLGDFMDKKNIGAIIGQSINILCAHDPEFKQLFLMKHIACSEHREVFSKPVPGSLYSEDCVKCNMYIESMEVRVKRTFEKLLHFEQYISKGIQSSPVAPPMTRTVLAPDTVGQRFNQNGRYRLYKDKSCVIADGEEAILYCAGKPFSPPSQGQFPKYILPVWLVREDIENAGKIVQLEIPASSNTYLNTLHVDKGITLSLSGQNHQGNFGSSCRAQWKKV